ncbi:MAG: hypothetical protein CME69_12605 [Halobacteriovorax sp.]|nr:hypothetical protein [Halobacteriovorax sp.]
MKSVTRAEMLEKFKLILKPEKSFYIVSFIYGLGVSLLSLAIPISIQSLVNTVAFSMLSQPLIILCFVLLSLLMFSGVLNALQIYILELFQQKFYARTTSELSVKLINAQNKEFLKRNGTDLVNRYFDVMTVQKSMTSLLTEGVAIFLQTVVGVLMLAFYHPYFLAFALILVTLLWLVWVLFRKKAISSAVYESKAKYNVAGWLKEIGRVNILFKSRQQRECAINTSDELIGDYLKYRKLHFKQVYFQAISLLAIYAIMSALIFGLGGFLVIKGQLTLGQLVAAELIVTLILGNFSKASKYLESFYDLYAAVDKISHLYELPAEDNKPEQKYEFDNYNISFNNAAIKVGETKYSYNFDFEYGKNFYAHLKHNSKKVIFNELLQRVINPEKGVIKVGNYSIQEISPLDLRDIVHVISTPTFFEGTIFENLTVGNKNIKRSEAIEALEIVNLSYIIDTEEKGLDTKILSSGYPFWSSQLIRLEIARAIIKKPKVVVITELIDQIDDETRNMIMNYLLKMDSTFILFSNKSCSGFKFDKYLKFDDYKIVAYDSEQALKEASE